MPHPAIAIRRALIHEAPLVAEIGARTFRETFAPDNNPADMTAYLGAAFSIGAVAAEIGDANATFLLAFDAAQGASHAVGYAKLLTGPAHPAVSGPDPIQLVRLYVDSEMIGRGHGAALMRSSLDACTQGDFRTVWLGVWEHNDRARRFYARWGFHAVGTQEFVLGSDVQTDVVMERAITLE